MQIRGCAKRHTVGCTEDLSITHNTSEQASTPTKPQTSTGIPNNQGINSGIRTRRTGLLTVTERPPGKITSCFFNCRFRYFLYTVTVMDKSIVKLN